MSKTLTLTPLPAIVAVDITLICPHGVGTLNKINQLSRPPRVVVFGFGQSQGGDVALVYRLDRYFAVYGYAPEDIFSGLTQLMLQPSLYEKATPHRLVGA